VTFLIQTLVGDVEKAMRTIITGLLSAGLVVALAIPSDAASRKRGTYYYSGGYTDGFPSASARKRHNAWAYNHPGHYYEADSNAFPVGSRGWWEMKRLEGSGGRVR
jgi:hypothetical protein